MLLKKSRDRETTSYVDWSGAIAITTGLITPVYTLERAGSIGWQSAKMWIALGVARLLLIAFMFIETRSPMPLVPLQIFRRRSIIAGTSLGALMNASLGASVFILTLYIQKVLKYSPLQAGLGFMPEAVVAIAFRS